MNPITALLSALGGAQYGLRGALTRAVVAAKRMSGAEHSPATDARSTTAEQIGVGAVTNFFDTLGIGSFATTTACFRLRRMVPDRVIPGTLNSGHALPIVVEAFAYMAFIPVDVLTLVSMIAASVLGAWLGAGVVARWSRRKVQIGRMALALLGAATLMLMKQLALFPSDGEAIGVRGARLMPMGSLRFIREHSYSLRAAVGLAIGGIPGVLV